MKSYIAIRLLIIERSFNEAEAIVTLLRNAGLPVRPQYLADIDDLHGALNRQVWDMLVAHPDNEEVPVLEACQIVSASGQDIPVIVLNAALSEVQIRELFEAGAKRIVPPDSHIQLEMAIRHEFANLEERRKRHTAEHLWQEIYRQNKILFESARDAIAYVHDGVHVQANPAYLELFGYSDMEALEGLPLMDLVAPQSRAAFKRFLRDCMKAAEISSFDRETKLLGLRADGGKFGIRVCVSSAYCAEESCLQVVVLPAAGEQKLEQQLREAWRVDPLTGLYNRIYFNELLGKTLARDMRGDHHHFVLYLMVDKLDMIRESYGLSPLERLSVRVGEILQPLRNKMLIARFDDGMFALLTRNSTLPDMEAVAEKLRIRVEGSHVDGEGYSLPLTCSIGITPVLTSAASARAVLNNAYNACRQAAGQGGNRIEVYQAEPKRAAGTFKIAPGDIREFIDTAMNAKRLSLWYLPIVGLYREDPGDCHEVYLKILDEKGRKVPSADLFASASEAGCTALLDKWIIRKSMDVLLRHYQSGMNSRFFVKISGASLNDEELCLFIGKLLRTKHLPPERLVFEISEAVAASHLTQVYAFINALRKLGCQTALEHYGSGLNSAALMKRLPVDYVKIDASYSRGLADNPKNQAAITEVVTLAHSLDKPVIAEGVEEANTLTVLFSCQVDYVQGYYVRD